MAERGTTGLGLKVIANGRSSQDSADYDENSIHKVSTDEWIVIQL